MKMIGMNNYQEAIEEFDLYPTNFVGDLGVLTGLVSEAGEVADVYNKYIRGDHKYAGPAAIEFNPALKKELGDVLWFVATLSRRLGFSLSDVADANLTKLTSRKERGVLRGDGDER